MKISALRNYLRYKIKDVCVPSTKGGTAYVAVYSTVFLHCIRKIIIMRDTSRFTLDVARSRSDARPDFRSGRGSEPYRVFSILITPSRLLRISKKNYLRMNYTYVTHFYSSLRIYYASLFAVANFRCNHRCDF